MHYTEPAHPTHPLILSLCFSALSLLRCPHTNSHVTSVSCTPLCCSHTHAVSLLGMAVVAATGTGEPADQDAAAAAAAAGQQEAEALPPPLPRVNAVLVFGGTGKLGRKVVEKVGRKRRLRLCGGDVCVCVCVCCRRSRGFHRALSCAVAVAARAKHVSPAAAAAYAPPVVVFAVAHPMCCRRTHTHTFNTPTLCTYTAGACRPHRCCCSPQHRQSNRGVWGGGTAGGLPNNNSSCW